MNRITAGVTVAALCALLILIGCSNFGGTYETSNGVASVSFRSCKAYMTMLGNTEICDYEIKGDQIVVHTKIEHIVFTKNDDGTIDGPLGNMKKRKS